MPECLHHSTLPMIFWTVDSWFIDESRKMCWHVIMEASSQLKGQMKSSQPGSIHYRVPSAKASLPLNLLSCVNNYIQYMIELQMLTKHGRMLPNCSTSGWYAYMHRASQVHFSLWNLDWYIVEMMQLRGKVLPNFADNIMEWRFEKQNKHTV